MLRKIVATIFVILRNLFLGSSSLSLSLLLHPKKMINYINESLFLYKTLNSKRGLPQKNVFEVLPTKNMESIKLGNLKFGRNWFLPSASYAVDVVSLCLICQIIKPIYVFEIGTLTGYTSFHFALNTTSNARVYILDLHKDKGH